MRWINDRLQNSAEVGGFLSGSLHALTGADHMVALLPLICNRRWWIGGSIGAAWGVGHSVSSSTIGCLSYLMKSYLVPTSSWLTDYQYIVDFVVGATLIIIGVMGYFESREVKDAVHKDSGDDCTISDSREGGASSSSPTTARRTTVSALAAVFINGCVMGLSLDGVPSLAPSLFMDSVGKLTIFFCSYTLGTMLVICMTAGLAAEATCWMSEQFSNRSGGMASRLSVLSSLVAVAIGLCWISAALFKTHAILSVSYPAHPQSNDDGVEYKPMVDRHQQQMDAALATASVLSVLGIVLGTALCELRALRSQPKKSHIHYV